jgi:hypothetical protein
MFEKLINALLLRPFRAEMTLKKFFACLESEAADELLETLLKLMSLLFRVSKKYRENIGDFNGRYLFESADGSITASAVFGGGRMKVKGRRIDNPDIAVIFKDAKALRGFIFSPKPDILGSMLRQDVVLEGNLNYIYKFAYMANHLKQRPGELL